MADGVQPHRILPFLPRDSMINSLPGDIAHCANSSTYRPRRLARSAVQAAGSDDPARAACQFSLMRQIAMCYLPHARGSYESLPLWLLRRPGERVHLLADHDHPLPQAYSFTPFGTGPGPLPDRSAKPPCGADIHSIHRTFLCLSTSGGAGSITWLSWCIISPEHGPLSLLGWLVGCRQGC